MNKHERVTHQKRSYIQMITSPPSFRGDNKWHLVINFDFTDHLLWALCVTDREENPCINGMSTMLPAWSPTYSRAAMCRCRLPSRRRQLPRFLSSLTRWVRRPVLSPRSSLIAVLSRPHCGQPIRAVRWSNAPPSRRHGRPARSVDALPLPHHPSSSHPRRRRPRWRRRRRRLVDAVSWRLPPPLDVSSSITRRRLSRRHHHRPRCPCTAALTTGRSLSHQSALVLRVPRPLRFSRRRHSGQACTLLPPRRRAGPQCSRRSRRPGWYFTEPFTQSVRAGVEPRARVLPASCNQCT